MNFHNSSCNQWRWWDCADSFSIQHSMIYQNLPSFHSTLIVVTDTVQGQITTLSKNVVNACWAFKYLPYNYIVCPYKINFPMEIHIINIFFITYIWNLMLLSHMCFCSQPKSTDGKIQPIYLIELFYYHSDSIEFKCWANQIYGNLEYFAAKRKSSHCSLTEKKTLIEQCNRNHFSSIIFIGKGENCYHQIE